MWGKKTRQTFRSRPILRLATSQIRRPCTEMAERVKRRRLSIDGTFQASSPDGDIEKSAPTPPERTDQRRSLFVRSLPASVTTERLTEHFSQSYPLKHATVVTDPKTKLSKGYGFVTFADPEDAQKAAQQLNNSILDGRKIKVEVAEPRHREHIQEGEPKRISSKAAELHAEREKRQADVRPPKLIVRNLPWSIKESEDLVSLFRSYGKIKHAVVPKRGPKVQAGFGFVVIRGRKNAEKAIAGVNGKEVDGRTLAVDWAVDKATWNNLQRGEEDGEKLGQELPSGPAEGVHDILENQNAPDSDSSVRADDSDEIEKEESMEDVDPDAESRLDHDEETDDSSVEDGSEKQPDNTTIFVRNLPFTCTDDFLREHFSKRGAVRYARVVFDHETERSKGTGFVCFFNEADAKSCVKNAPKHQTPAAMATTDKKRRGEAMAHSVLQNEASDPTGHYTLDGRVLQVSRALSKTEAAKREAEGSEKRDIRDRDKRRLYLLSEGTIPRGSKLYEKLAPTEVNIREASVKQRQKLIKSNPSLHLSLTRLSVRNIPRSVSSKDLKALAREAVVGFAKDVKAGLRQPLSKEELSRGAEAMREAEKTRKELGKGIVKQATIVFEGREGTKVPEKSGGGRSRGYGFIEYVSHRNALMGLRWLNGHAVKPTSGEPGDKTKRLIVEFAIENAQVVTRRREREAKERLTKSGPRRFKPKAGATEKATDKSEANSLRLNNRPGNQSKKRKRIDKPEDQEKRSPPTPQTKEPISQEGKNRLAMRNRIIARKRMARKARKGGR
jgi:nucleolar protein 4